MNEILVVGIVLFFGYLGGKLIARIKVPAVTGYFLIGLAFGVSFLKIIPESWSLKLGWLIEFALILIAFTVGGEIKRSTLRSLGRSIFSIVIFETFGAYFLILLAMLLLHQPLALSLLIAAIGSSTAPAVTVLVLNEYRAKGPLTQTLLACVGLDDALGLAAYSVSASLAHSLFLGVHVSVPSLAGLVALGVVISLGLGIIAGLLLSNILRWVRYPLEILTVTLGTLTLIGGLLQLQVGPLHFSPLLGSMAMGFYMSNFPRRRKDVFAPLQNFGYPFYTIYFVLAGARLHIRMLAKLGLVALGYLLGRFTGKVLGANLGATISKAPLTVRKYTGFGLFSQAGIAIGLCLLAAREFPSVSSIVVAVGLGTTIVTEIVGPFSTKYVITKAGEVGKKT
ncbi:MAG TPA: cation:proton antiporter [Candidatus Latescibacteria bacterium]|nr:cation:proton antiporter [Candidatus Latescibacterota bacterium]